MTRSALAVLTLALVTPATAQQPDAGKRINVDVEDTDLARVMFQIGEQAGVTILVDPAVNEQVYVSLRDIEWREAAEVIARMTRCETEEWPGEILYIHQPAKLTLAGADMSGRKLLELAARSAGRSVVILPAVEGVIPAVDFKEVHWLRVMHTVAKLLGAKVYEVAGTVVVAPADFPPPSGADDPEAPALTGGKKVSFHAEGHDLADVCDLLGRKVGKNVLVDPNVVEAVKGNFVNVPWKDAVNALGRLTGCQVEQRPGGILILGQPPHVTLQASRAPLPELFQLLSGYAGKNLAVASGDYPSVTLELSDFHWLSAIHLIAWANGLSIEESDEDLLTVGPGASRSAAADSPPRPDDAITRIVDAIERSARAGDAAGLESQTRELVELVRRRGQAARNDEGGLPLDNRELEQKIEDVFRQIMRLAQERQHEELVTRFTLLRELMSEYGEAGTEQVRKTLEKWNRRLADLGEVRLSIQLQIYINEGNRYLREMAAARDAGDALALEATYLELQELVKDMYGEEREVFHRNGAAIEIRGETLYEEGQEQAKTRDLTIHVQAIVVVPPDSDDRSSVLINGVVCHVGDEVEGAADTTVVKIQPSVITFRTGTTQFTRELGR